MYSLIPSILDLFQAVHFGLLVCLISGLGFLLGARRPETALFSGWGLSSLAIVVSGCLLHTSLVPVALILAVLGAIGIVVRLTRWRGMEWGTLLRVGFLAIPLVLILLSFHTTAYDDFAFWGPNLISLCENAHFPSLAHPLTASFMPAYPRGVSLTGFGVFLMQPNTSPAGIIRLLSTGPWWNVTCMFAVVAAITYNVERRFQDITTLEKWGVAGLAILSQMFLDPGFIPKMTLSNMGDASSASGFAMIIMLLYEWFEGGHGRRTIRICAELALTACAVVYVRQDNWAIMVGFIVALIYLVFSWQTAGKLKSIIAIILVSLPAWITQQIWTSYAATEIVGPHHALIPFCQWHWYDFFHYTIYSVEKVLLAKGVYTILAFLLIGFAIFFNRAKSDQDIPKRKILTVVAFFVVWNASIILFAYLATNFSQYDVRTAVTFWRFLAQTAPAEMAAIACIIPLSWWKKVLSKKLSITFALIASLVPIAILPTRWTFRYDLQSPVPAFLSLGKTIGSSLPKKASIQIFDASDRSGFAAWIIKFGMIELARTKQSIKVLFSQKVPSEPGVFSRSGNFLIVTTGKNSMQLDNGKTLLPWTAYVLTYKNHHFSMENTYSIPEYR